MGDARRPAPRIHGAASGQPDKPSFYRRHAPPTRPQSSRRQHRIEDTIAFISSAAEILIDSYSDRAFFASIAAITPYYRASGAGSHHAICRLTYLTMSLIICRIINMPYQLTLHCWAARHHADRARRRKKLYRLKSYGAPIYAI